MATDDLTDEQKVAYFQEVTGLADPSQCVQVLEAHSWDLDAAIATILAIRDRDDAGNPPFEGGDFGAGPSSRSSPQENGGYDDIMQRNIQPPGLLWRTLHVPGALARGGLGLAFGAIGLGLWAASGVLSTVGGAASWALGGGDASRHGVIETEAQRFVRSFESEYGVEHPEFQDLGFMQAVRLAQGRFKCLLVYLHSPEHVNTPAFCRQVLTSDPVIQYLNETFIVWGGSVRSPEGFGLSLSLKASTFPYLAVVTGSSSQRVALLHCIEGPTRPEVLLEALAKVVEEQGAMLVAARADEEERALNRRLREEQDAAYQASVQADREREEARQAEEERKRQEAEAAERAAREERERVEAEERAAGEREAVLEKRRAEKAAVLAEEPESGPDVTQVLVRLPNGDRVARRFACESPIQAVYDWVDTLKSMEHAHYSLLMSYPREVYGPEKRQLSLKALKLHPRATLFVQVDEE